MRGIKHLGTIGLPVVGGTGARSSHGRGSGTAFNFPVFEVDEDGILWVTDSVPTQQWSVNDNGELEINVN